MHETITSAQNPRLKLARRLRDKRSRDQEQRFVIDDWRDLERAIENGYQIETLLYAPELAGKRHTAFLAVAQDTFRISVELLDKVGYRENASGVVAILHQKARRTYDDLPRAETGPVLGLVDLRKPGNIGALLRSADASGFSTILLIDTALDLYNPNLIRSSTGACFLDNIYYLTSQEAQRYFQRHGYTVLSAHLQGDKSLYEVTIPHQSVVLLGTEDQGLSDYWMDYCTLLLKIPMTGRVVDSLNVSVAGAVIMYEAYRQRTHPIKST